MIDPPEADATPGESPSFTPSSGAHQAAGEFEKHREALFSIAYRMVGGVFEAEDLVQDAYLRWRSVETPVESPRRFLMRTVTRLAIDHLRSARVRREDYVGPWLPEPLVTARDRTPVDPAEMSESLSAAFLLMLERLAPLERAVFLLREVFDFDYEEVGRMVERKPSACRQIAKRARDRVAMNRTRFEVAPEDAERIAETFMTACSSGDMEAVLPLLAGDAVTWSDSGGRVTAARRPIFGADRNARFWAGVGGKGYAAARVQQVWVNGAPGFVIRTEGGPTRVLGFAFSGGQIGEIFVYANPSRLGHLPAEG